MAWNDPPSFDYQQMSNSAKFKHRYVKVGQSQQFQPQQFQQQQFQPQQFQPHQQQSMPAMQESCNNIATYDNGSRDNFAMYNGEHVKQDSQYKGPPMEQTPCVTATSALPIESAGNFAGQVAGPSSANLFQGGR